MGHGQRRKEVSIRLRDYVTNTIRKLSPSPLKPSPRHSSGTPYPIAYFVNCDNFSTRHRNFLATIAVEREPVQYSEAVKDSRWRDAMQREIEALKMNETWVIEDLTAGKKALGCNGYTRSNITPTVPLKDSRLK